MASVPEKYCWPNKLQPVSRTQTFYETYRHEVRGMLIIGFLLSAFGSALVALFDLKPNTTASFKTETTATAAVVPAKVRTDISPGDTIYVQQGQAKQFRKVVGLPGDTVQILNGTVLRNGSVVRAKQDEPLTIPYHDAVMLLNRSSYFAVEETPSQVALSPAGAIFRQEQVIGRIPASSK